MKVGLRHLGGVEEHLEEWGVPNDVRRVTALTAPPL
jgi:hypothetical protein